jgi:hypothetical protein
MAAHSTYSKLVLVCLASSIVPSASALTIAVSAAQALGVLEGRQTAPACADPSFSRCGDTDLPSNFCCSSGSTCISLDSSSTALCCPKGADCKKIQPISCDLSFQDLSSRPNAEIMTTKTGDKLATCGSKTCCPFGYSCEGDSQCVLDNPTSSTKASSSSVSSSSTLSTSSRSASSAVAVGFFPGLLLGAILALLSVICLGRRRPYDERPGSKSSTWSSAKYSHSQSRGRGANGTITGISDPIPMHNGARTDFLRRQPTVLLRDGASRAKTWLSSKSSPTLRDEDGKVSPLNPVNHWKMPTPPYPNNIPLRPLGSAVPVTPPSQIRSSAATLARESSKETITVYSPPSMFRPASQSGFTPLYQQQRTPKSSIMEKLIPFRSTDSTAKNANSASSAPGNSPPDLSTHPAYSTTTTYGPRTPSPARGVVSEPDQQSTTLPSTQYQGAYQTPNDSGSLHPPTSSSAPPDSPAAYQSRPATHMTTFTDVLRDAGLERDSHIHRPAVPMIPKGLDWRSAAKKAKTTTAETGTTTKEMEKEKKKKRDDKDGSRSRGGSFSSRRRKKHRKHTSGGGDGQHDDRLQTSGFYN